MMGNQFELAEETSKAIRNIMPNPTISNDPEASNKNFACILKALISINQRLEILECNTRD